MSSPQVIPIPVSKTSFPTKNSWAADVVTVVTPDVLSYKTFVIVFDGEYVQVNAIPERIISSPIVNPWAVEVVTVVIPVIELYPTLLIDFSA